MLRKIKKTHKQFLIETSLRNSQNNVNNLLENTIQYSSWIGDAT